MSIQAYLIATAILLDPVADPNSATPDPSSNPWAGRSGYGEALRDLAKGGPVKLYYQNIAGERLEIRTPGLRNCNPDRYDVTDEARSKLVPLGADFSESIQYTDDERRRFTSASRFARAYNLTIFRHTPQEVLKVCPAATIDESIEVAPDPWAGRSGEAEALADLASGRPVKLYTHVWGGERAGFRSPGLLYCDPDQNIGNKAAEAMFAFIPEANMSEGVIYTPAEQSLQRSASAFARAYNLTVFHQKRDYVVALCPKVELERKQAVTSHG